MNIDKQLYRLPVAGNLLRRLYDFFQKNTLVANVIHISGGIALGRLVVNSESAGWGYAFLTVYLVGHVYAFWKGSQ